MLIHSSISTTKSMHRLLTFSITSTRELLHNRKAKCLQVHSTDRG